MAERTGIWGMEPPSQGFHSLCKTVKPVFLLRCHGSRNSVHLCQKFEISGEVQQIQLRTDGRENGNLGDGAPKSGVPLTLQNSETRILIKMSRISKFGSPLSKIRNFRGGSTNSAEDRWQRERESGGWSPQVRGSTHFAKQ